MNILNIGIKLFIILIGVVFILDYLLDLSFLSPIRISSDDQNLNLVFGIVFFLYGLYRLSVYRIKKKEYETEE
jgi:hypothetical protein